MSRERLTTPEGVSPASGSAQSADVTPQALLIDPVAAAASSNSGGGSSSSLRIPVDASSPLHHAAGAPHIIFLAVHGIGASDTYIQECHKNLDRAIRKLRKYWFWEMEFSYHLEFIDWKSDLAPLQQSCFERLLVAPGGDVGSNAGAAFWDFLPGAKKAADVASLAASANAGQRRGEGVAPSSTHRSSASSSAFSQFDSAASRDDSRLQLGDVLAGATFPTGASDLTNPKKLLCNNISDLMSFMTPTVGDRLVTAVGTKLNETVHRLRESMGQEAFEKSRVCLIGHSLGGVILYELLTRIPVRPTNCERVTAPAQAGGESGEERQFGETGTPIAAAAPAGAPPLNFAPAHVFLWGSPLSAFALLRHADGGQPTPFPAPGSPGPRGGDRPAALCLPPNVRVYNVFHPSDPIAFRLEPVFHQALFVGGGTPPAPVRLPHWRNNGTKSYMYWQDDLKRTGKAITSFIRQIRDQIGNTFSANKNTLPTLDLPRYRVNRRKCYQQATDAARRYGAHDRRICLRQGGGRARALRAQSAYELMNRFMVRADQRAALIESLTTGLISQSSGSLSASELHLISQAVSRSFAAPEALVPTKLASHIVENEDAESLEQENADDKIDANDEKSATQKHDAAKTAAGEELIRVEEGSARVSRGAQATPPGETVLAGAPQSDENSNPTTSSAEKTAANNVGGLNGTPDGESFEVMGESEDSLGLELPVRLDFALQPEIGEYYVEQWGSLLSHYGYWDSRDTVLFMLKQVLNFRPILAYPDAVKIYQSIQATAATAAPAVTTPPSPSSLFRRERTVRRVSASSFSVRSGGSSPKNVIDAALAGVVGGGTSRSSPPHPATGTKAEARDFLG